MLHDVLKNVLFVGYKPQDIVSFFVSLYDEKDVLLASQWLLSSTKPLAESLDLMMRWVLQQYEAKTHMLVVDVIADVQEEPDITALLARSPTEYGVCLADEDGAKSGVLLPGTAGIKDMKQAIQVCQQKNQLSGKVVLYSFRTKRSTYVLATA
jgi:hypothetical protein